MRSWLAHIVTDFSLCFKQWVELLFLVCSNCKVAATAASLLMLSTCGKGLAYECCLENEQLWVVGPACLTERGQPFTGQMACTATRLNENQPEIQNWTESDSCDVFVWLLPKSRFPVMNCRCFFVVVGAVEWMHCSWVSKSIPLAKVFCTLRLAPVVCRPCANVQTWQLARQQCSLLAEGLWLLCCCERLLFERPFCWLLLSGV